MDEERVRGLLRAQFPGWADLPLVEWHEQGTDHTLFRLGDDMAVRMPIRPFTDAPLEEQRACREARWVPFLAPQLPLDLPAQLGFGEPTDDYPWHWSIVSWIEGDRIDDSNIDALTAAVELARFVKALHEIDPTDGPPAGKATWGRGTSLRPGAQIIRDAIARASKRLDTGPLLVAWEEAVAADEWDGPPVWFHGDLAGNLIVRDRRLVGVIDSPYGIGDPACDITPGWSLFTGETPALLRRDRRRRRHEGPSTRLGPGSSIVRAHVLRRRPSHARQPGARYRAGPRRLTRPPPDVRGHPPLRSSTGTFGTT